MAKGAKTGGRSKGTPNKVTADLKAMLEGALSDVGGRDYFVKQAEDNPAAFMTLVGKLLPKDVQLSGANGEPIKFVVSFGS